MTYEEWIEEYCMRQDGALLGKCHKAVEEMMEAFPELVKVKGHVFTVWGKRGHVWCEAPDGAVVDPTAGQFPPPIFEYEPWVPGSEVRVGRCMNCGEDIWRRVQSLEEAPASACICSTACAKAFEMDMEGTQ